MGIERIEIEGFRSLKHVVWEPSNLNVLIGPNGSGKSNLLRALEMLSAAAQGTLAEVVERSRGFRELAWNHSSQDMSWALATTIPGPDEVVSGEKIGREDRVDYHLTILDEGPYGWFRVGREKLIHHPTPGEDPELDKHMGADTRAWTVIDRDINQATVFNGPNQPQAPPRLKPQDVLLFTANPLGIYPISLACETISKWTCYQDMSVNRDAKLRGSAQARRMDVVQSDGQNLVSVIHTHYQKDEDFTRAIDDAMRAAFGDDFDKLMTPPAEDTRVQLRLKWKSLSDSLSAAELSDGILRFLLLISILSQPNPPPLIAIDEPETGLHPSMLPIIAEYAIEASQKTQVILTTHSPEFLDAFSAADAVPKVTVAFWEDGQTMLKTPREDVLQHWLKEYTLGRLMTSGELAEIAE